MDQLKALLQAKKKAAGEEFQGKKFLKRSEIEELRLKRLRDEEEQERTAKVSSPALGAASRRGRRCCRPPAPCYLHSWHLAGSQRSGADLTTLPSPVGGQAPAP